MAIPAFTGLNTALRGVQAQQAALDVVAHNIANVETPGYSRQEAVFSAVADAARRRRQAGRHRRPARHRRRRPQSYRRLRDDFLDLQFRAQNMASGQSDVTAKRLSVVQADLASGSTSDLGTLLDKFWSSWDTLAANPTSTDAKAAVVGTAQTLAQRFTTLDADIASTGTQATAAISDLLSDDGPIKPIATELAQLNQQINMAKQRGRLPQRPARPPRPAARQALGLRPGVGHGRPDARRRRQARLPGHDPGLLRRRRDPAGLPDHGDDADGRDAVGHARRPARRPAGRRRQGRRLPRDARRRWPSR